MPAGIVKGNRMHDWHGLVTVLKVVGKLVLVVLIGTVIEGCMRIDPCVDLGNGYTIVAISWGEPCQLVYWSERDTRPSSGWYVFSIEGKRTLLNPATHEEGRQYASREEEQQAIRELHARPDPGESLLEDVKLFARDKRHAIGRSAKACFLLDTAGDQLETWPSEAEWAAAVRARTSLDPNRLYDPKDWRFQYRRPATWGIMGFYLALGLAWVVVPLVRSRRPRRLLG
jgi:hypothetical protein